MQPVKPVTVEPVRPNAGIEASYRRALDKLIADMQASVEYWLVAAYRANEPESLAMDESPARALDARMAQLTRQWQKKFDKIGPEIAKRFVDKVKVRTNLGFNEAFKKAGFTVKFRMSRAQNDAIQATLAENVGLIKSIASEHLSDIQGMVMRSVTQGRDIHGLRVELQERYGITRRRAALISRDQNNKATATIVRVRQREAGVTQALWIHSSGGKHPRPSHVAANGKTYEVAKGMKIDGEWILPGELINCRCVSRAIVPVS